jgi:hypothetical protein
MAASNSTTTTHDQKLCIAFKEPIPIDAEVCFHCRTRQAPEPVAKEPESKRLLAWIGRRHGSDRAHRGPKRAGGATKGLVWSTYESVSPPAAEASDFTKMEARFIQANIDEVSGKT